MSKPRDIWWSYARGMVKQYPRLRQEYADVKTCSVTSTISGMPRGGAISDPTAKAAIRELPPDKMRELRAVEDAIADTLKMPNGAERIKVIKLVLWDKSHTLAGAAMQIPCHVQTAKEWHRQFIRLVAVKAGLATETLYPRAKKML